uniref:Uncharacterized protein n=1 Tax=Salix viminalis TaxID=40686 RepID=A0A6N2MG71_SALVM
MLEWASRASFEDPAKDMNIRKSTLIQQYPTDMKFEDLCNWETGLVAFLQLLGQQNVTLDVERFRPTLVRALQLLHQ